jgi:C4-dicarboxylate-specific signal transduction histidine kinase
MSEADDIPVRSEPRHEALHREGSRALGLRTQIVFALGALLVLAFVPLFFAVASLVRITLAQVREESARALGRTIAAHVAEVRTERPEALDGVLRSHVGEGGASFVCVFDREGRVVARAGSPGDDARAPARPYGEGARVLRRDSGPVLEIVVPTGADAVMARMPVGDDREKSAPLLRLVALYTVVFALALLVFAYFALTRLIVRPVEELGRATDRVAGGQRGLRVPHRGARELIDLATSVQAMTERLFTNEDELKAKVAELTRATEQLRAAQEDLVRNERLASVGRLSAGIAHEIGNPIAAILGMHDLLADDDLPKETRDDFLARMRKETERINGIVRDLLDFARPEKASPVESGAFRPSTVESVVRDVVGLVKTQKDVRVVDVEVEVPDEPVTVALSPQRLTQVLLNLLLNAAGAVRGVSKPTILVRVTTDDARVRVTVEDNGPGVPADMRERIFLPFVTTKDVGEGTGLGLSVCRGLVEGAGGKIYVDAEYTRGARFVVELPALVL